MDVAIPVCASSNPDPQSGFAVIENSFAVIGFRESAFQPPVIIMFSLLNIGRCQLKQAFSLLMGR